MKQWADLADERISFSEQAARDASARALAYLSVDTAATCNLTCPGMCYYNSSAANQDLVSLDLQMRAIEEACEYLSLGVLTFAGKEPLIGIRRLEKLALFANQIRNRPRIGVVTNGTLVVRHWATLDRLVAAGAIDFIDVSLNSARADEHDRIRGMDGAFERAAAALARMVPAWTDVRVGVTSVLRPDNLEGILELVANPVAGVVDLFVFPMQRPVFHGGGGTPWRVISEFLRRATALLASNSAKVRLSTALLGVHLPEALAEGVFRLSEIEEDEFGQIYIRRRFGSAEITIMLQVLPETGRDSLRMLSTGDVLPNTHYLQSDELSRHVIGNVRDRSLVDLRQLAVGRGSALEQLWFSREGHDCRQRDCWSLCFGGLSVADHALVAGASLQAQPALCSKQAVGCTEAQL